MSRSNTARHRRLDPTGLVDSTTVAHSVEQMELAAFESVLLAFNAMMDAARVGAHAHEVAASTELVARHAMDTLQTLRRVPPAADRLAEALASQVGKS